MSEKSKRETVKDVDHTHPHTDETFGENGVYERGSKRSDEDEDPEDPDEVTGGTDEPENRTGRDDRETRSDGGRRIDRADRNESERDHTAPSGDPVQETFDRR